MSDKSLEGVLKELNKLVGSDVVSVVGADKGLVVEAIPTTCMSLDHVLACGGLPRGRIIEIFGSESCLDGSTFINYDVRKKDGTAQNRKGGTIKRLYDRFHRLPIAGSGNYQKKQSIDSIFYVSSINENNGIIKNRILDVVDCGEKECFVVTTKTGYKLTCTKEHKFYIGEGLYAPLEDLSVGSIVYIHNNSRIKGRAPIIRYKEVMVKYHPTATKKIVNGYTYYRVKRSHIVFEAHLNNLSVEDYISFLNKESRANIDKKIKTVPKGSHLHHIDFDPNNDTIENLKLLNGKEHNRLHALNNGDKLNFVAVEDVITKIDYVGNRHTYDIKCLYPYNNYIANNIVVHNSGKSTLSMHLCSIVQKSGGRAAWIDAEFSFARNYAESVGMNVDELILAQPESGEDAMEIVRKLIKNNLVDILVVDSVSALVPKDELDKPFSEETMAKQARMMSRALRVLTGIISQTKTSVIFINQTRSKIGLVFGKKETTSGGNALKFYASVRLEVHKGKQIKDANGDVIGNWLKVVNIKNKVGFPFRQAEFELFFGSGIDILGDMIDFATGAGVITRGGSSYSYGETRLGAGREAAKKFLLDNPETLEKIKKEVINKYDTTTGKAVDTPEGTPKQSGEKHS